MANATPITLGSAEVTVTGTTTASTFDGALPTACGCTGRNNVWYRFTLAARTLVYADTAGSPITPSVVDTSLYFADSAGIPLTNLCNDDSGCTTGGFTNGWQSRIAGVLPAGSYYLVVDGCSTGNFTLHVQQIATATALTFNETALTTPVTAANLSGTLTGTTSSTRSCAGDGPEVAWWYMTCGGAVAESFTTCRSEGGSFTYQIGSTTYDPVLYVRSAATGTDLACNDDSGGTAGLDCTGSILPGTTFSTLQRGARLPTVTAQRGVNVLFLDNFTNTSGMQYSIRYTLH
jgi:hypothetical protein